MKRFLILPLVLVFLPVLASAEMKCTLETPYVFTDESAVIRVDASITNVEYSIKTITREGWGPDKSGDASAVQGTIKLFPLAEGIHIVTLKSGAGECQCRFLAMEVPSLINPDKLKKALRHSAAKLLSGKPVAILAMGDSVAFTGDYGTMLVMMLKRVLGNQNISLYNKSYPGRSVDAAVRFFKTDAVPVHPDIGLLMYGLNDQGGGCALAGYLEQYRYVEEHMEKECNADTVFLRPTPDISIPVTDSARKDNSSPAYYIFRTIAFGESLKPLAEKLSIPLADTFSALWGKGGTSLEDTAKNMWQIYPLNYDRQMTSMIENNGSGDTVHPNALGHLLIAKAVYRAMTGQDSATPPLKFRAETSWTAEGVLTRITATNASAEPRKGKLVVYPLIGGDLKMNQPGEYELEPGHDFRVEVSWPQVKTADDLLKYPWNEFLGSGNPVIPVVDFSGDSSRVYGVFAPFEVEAGFVNERHVIAGNEIKVRLNRGGMLQEKTVKIPGNSEVGRIPLKEKVEKDGKTGWAVAELAYVRYGKALAGEANVDGTLDEWDRNSWIPVGEHVQARWVHGIEDNRSDLDECYLHWAFKAGQRGMFIAVKATGVIKDDGFFVFFDTREPALLGTAGPYYWVSGKLQGNGTVQLDKGETSAQATGMKGAYKSIGNITDIELFIPYDLMDSASWPVQGDLGLSIWWRHSKPGANAMSLLWSEDGHPWNTRWYGVVRKVDGPAAKVPYMVRIGR